MRNSGLTTAEMRGEGEKADSLPCLQVPAIKIYTVKAISLSLSNYTFNMTIFVNMWNFRSRDNFVKNWYFVNIRLIEICI